MGVVHYIIDAIFIGREHEGKFQHIVPDYMAAEAPKVYVHVLHFEWILEVLWNLS